MNQEEYSAKWRFFVTEIPEDEEFQAETILYAVFLPDEAVFCYDNLNEEWNQSLISMQEILDNIEYNEGMEFREVFDDWDNGSISVADALGQSLNHNSLYPYVNHKLELPNNPCANQVIDEPELGD